MWVYNPFTGELDNASPGAAGATGPAGPTGPAGTTDHGLLTGLADDDHVDYAYLPGRAGGQVLTGGTGNAEQLWLISTSGVTKGKVVFQPGGTNYDAVTDRFAIGQYNAAAPLDVVGEIRTSTQFKSTVATGTAPLSVASATLVPNLNADLLDGLDATAFAPAAGALSGVGAAGRVAFWTGASTLDDDDGLLYDATTDQLQIGAVGVGTGAALQIANDALNAIYMERHGSSAGPLIFSRSAGGTKAVPTATPINYALFALQGSGRGATTALDNLTKVKFAANAAEGWTDTAAGTFMTWEVTPIGSVTRATRMRLGPDGFLGLGASVTATELLHLSLATAGSTVTALAAHTDNTNGASNARLRAIVGGASGGDPLAVFSISGVQDWALGIDNSDSDRFKISRGSALGTTDALAISTAGLIEFFNGFQWPTGVGAVSHITGPSDQPLIIRSGTGQALKLGTNSIGDVIQILTGGDINIAETRAGAEMRVLMQNAGTTASTAVRLLLEVGGTSAGSPYLVYSIVGGAAWAIGPDNVDGDKLKIGSSATLGANLAISITTGGAVGIGTVNQTEILEVVGNFKLRTAGNKVLIKEGTNASMGLATLVGGTVTVSTTVALTTSRIFLTNQASAGTPGFLYVSARVNATSFTITSSSATDTSTVAWLIVEPG